ncbi:MAG: PHP domain-containing protein [Melioribacteraceae bacterium]|nr:PHP domain-containing protein [Melioribacteraceae bacterium]MCO6472498.1 PHP domain-containing protein [Melioribacteraceae bacterium]MDD3558110.1 PHP domain-containing protein [Melioribacteraceae bacterium]
MNRKVDLHMHTNYSDGALSPFELIKRAKEAGLEIISITDHDGISALEDAMAYGKDLGVEVIPGLEISTDIEDKEVHLLGYFIDIHDDELIKYLRFFREERFHRARRIVRKLRNLGLNITLDDVVDQAKNSAIGRPHIALAMLELGLINSYYEAFDKYIADNGPAYEKKIHISPRSALKLIGDAGGLSFIAHPGYMKESILTYLIKSGIDGIEVVHPSHKDHQVRFYRGIVSQYCLLESGGSDFHGGKKGDDDNLGKYYIAPNKLIAMRKMLLRDSA